MVSKALVVGAYQRKAEEIARCGVDLTVLIPPAWCDSRGEQQAEHIHTNGYRLQEIPLRRNGHFHTHYYPTLSLELRRLAPDILHMDEEPYNLATWRALRTATRLNVPTLFFTWQNIHKRYPPPFGWFERQNLRCADAAIAGNRAAETILRNKGFQKHVAVIPQFGVDPELFSPRAAGDESAEFTVGYAGGLLCEKGLDTLVRACARLSVDWRLDLAGAGDFAGELERLALELGVRHRVRLIGRLPSGQMADFYRTLDTFVLPSRTTNVWKEQFGRVLVEAMACGVPVVGSNSGEIPAVIGDAGLLFSEGHVGELVAHLERLAASADQRHHYGALGRARVHSHFTMGQIAQQTIEVYRRLCM